MLVRTMGPAIIRRATTGALTVMPIIDIRIGTVGIGDTIAGITIESLAPKMNCGQLWPRIEDPVQSCHEKFRSLLSPSVHCLDQLPWENSHREID
jgi:hypothetical protein